MSSGPGPLWKQLDGLWIPQQQINSSNAVGPQPPGQGAWMALRPGSWSSERAAPRVHRLPQPDTLLALPHLCVWMARP